MKKQKYTHQFFIKSAPEGLLWNFISDPVLMQRWIADRVTRDGNQFLFEWDGYEERNTLLEAREFFYERFHRDGEPDDTYWELSIGVDELTDDTVLTVTDFALPGEEEDERDVWDTQIQELCRQLGCS